MVTTIGICAYNEEKNIGKLLDNLINVQNLPFESEIFVICSGCSDSTPEIVRKFSQKDKRIKLILEKERRGKISAVNKLLKKYTGDYFFLIPADVIPAPSSISLLKEKMLSNPQIGVICGCPIPTNVENGFFGYLGHLMWRLHNRTLKYLNDLNLSTHASGEFMAFRRGIIEKIPLDVVNDDAYIAIQAYLKGIQVKYCEDAKVYIKAPTNIIDYIRQRRRVIYGHHCVKKETKHHPRTIESMIFYDPSKSINILKEEIIERPRDTPKLFLAIILEIFINLLAIIDFMIGKEHAIWDVVSSTKKLSI